MDNAQKIKWQKAMSYCLKNNIMVVPNPISNTELKLNVIYKGKKIEGKRIFKSNGEKDPKEQWHKVVELIYISYYNKLKSKENKLKT